MYVNSLTSGRCAHKRTNGKVTLVQAMAITWANVEPDLCRHVLPLWHNELIIWFFPEWMGLW